MSVLELAQSAVFTDPVQERALLDIAASGDAAREEVIRLLASVVNETREELAETKFRLETLERTVTIQSDKIQDLEDQVMEKRSKRVDMSLLYDYFINNPEIITSRFIFQNGEVCDPFGNRISETNPRNLILLTEELRGSTRFFRLNIYRKTLLSAIKMFFEHQQVRNELASESMIDQVLDMAQWLRTCGQRRKKKIALSDLKKTLATLDMAEVEQILTNNGWGKCHNPSGKVYFLAPEKNCRKAVGDED